MTTSKDEILREFDERFNFDLSNSIYRDFLASKLTTYATAKVEEERERLAREIGALARAVSDGWSNPWREGEHKAYMTTLELLSSATQRSHTSSRDLDAGANSL